MTLPNDFTNKAVLVTGGTKGIGLATGLVFGRRGAHVYLTHKWGSVEEAQVVEAFTGAGAPVPPTLVEADAAEDEDTQRLMEQIRTDHDSLEVLVSNVAFAQVGGGLKGLKKRSLMTSLGYTAWPLVSHLQRAGEVFGRHPRYVIGTSSDGPDTYYPGYDYVAAAKQLMEVLCRYLATHLLDRDTRVNVVRARPVSTDSLRATFGEEFEPFLRRHGSDRYLVDADQVADAILALCSGWMDAVSGEVITLDRGVSFSDNVMRLFAQREARGL